MNSARTFRRADLTSFALGATSTAEPRIPYRRREILGFLRESSCLTSRHLTVGNGPREPARAPCRAYRRTPASGRGRPAAPRETGRSARRRARGAELPEAHTRRRSRPSARCRARSSLRPNFVRCWPGLPHGSDRAARAADRRCCASAPAPLRAAAEPRRRSRTSGTRSRPRAILIDLIRGTLPRFVEIDERARRGSRRGLRSSRGAARRRAAAPTTSARPRAGAVRAQARAPRGLPAAARSARADVRARPRAAGRRHLEQEEIGARVAAAATSSGHTCRLNA